MSSQPAPIIYDGDIRYPGPQVHPPPEYITGIPTQQELDAQARMFTWGELKEVIQSGDLELLMRNKKMQARYDTWMIGMKEKYGSTEAYLTQARLPWAVDGPGEQSKRNEISQSPSSPHLEPPVPSSPNSYPYPPPPLSPQGEPSPNLKDPNGGLKVDVSDGQLLKARHARTPSITISPSESLPPSAPLPIIPQSTQSLSPQKRSPVMQPTLTPDSGTSTPSSVGFVSLSSLNLVNGKLRRSTPRESRSHVDLTANLDLEGGAGDEEAEEKPEYLRWDGWLDGSKYAVLPNDWPYNVPTGVRHYCVWSRIPIAHPDLVDYSPEAWSKIEAEGLGGFTGVTPLFRRKQYPTYYPASASPSPSPPDSGLNTPSPPVNVNAGAGRTKNLGHLAQDEWYAVDVDYSGKEKQKWAGVGYECQGGKEVGKMVKGLWDERGWECLWFVNPPRLQSVPGFSHFHVFARRKTPEEIDAAEAAIAAGASQGLRADGESAVPVVEQAR